MYSIVDGRQQFSMQCIMGTLYFRIRWLACETCHSSSNTVVKECGDLDVTAQCVFFSVMMN